MDFNKYIEIISDKRFGRPCIKGTRISVYDVLNWLANGMSKNDIIEDFPELNEDQINACLSFAAEREHRMRVASWNCFLIKIFLTDLQKSSNHYFPELNKSAVLDWQTNQTGLSGISLRGRASRSWRLIQTFYDLSLTQGHPPKLILIKSGNITTKNLETILSAKANQIQLFGEDMELSCLEIVDWRARLTIE